MRPLPHLAHILSNFENPKSSQVYVCEYLLDNGNHYIVGAFTDLQRLIDTINWADPSTIYWQRESYPAKQLQFAYGFYKPQPGPGEVWDNEKHGICAWRITGFPENSYPILEHFINESKGWRA